MGEIKTVIISFITTVLVNRYFLKKQYIWMEDFFEEEKKFIKKFISKFLEDFDQKG